MAGISSASHLTIGRMPGYEPVDLSAACNAGVDILGEAPGDVPLGRVDLRGLPFLIGSEPPSAERCFLLPGAPASVGIGRLARRVIVAHRLLEQGAPAGHAVGQTVAEYAFHLAGGEVITAPIRERFEIEVVLPPLWSRQPFLGVTDTCDHNLPRFRGEWGEAGFRLTEHARGAPAGYYLWCWENPHPERAVERIEFIPKATRFIVAGITTSDLDEHPFVRAPARPVRLVARDGRNGVLDIDVDRGVATYPQPLPGEDDRAGWGATEGTSAYASIAALPSATVAVRRAATSLAGCAGAMWNATGGQMSARFVLSWWKAAATGCMSPSSTTRPGGRYRAGSISVRPREFPISRTATTITSRRISAAGITTLAVRSAWDSAVTPTSTVPARGGCHVAR